MTLASPHPESQPPTPRKEKILGSPVLSARLRSTLCQQSSCPSPVPIILSPHNHSSIIHP
ncbi:hypothetical protein IE53DRAFT_388082 [Violaceomyces palustris]|uniref:Uncharacterized protein n=1 Tax=Violaceomyces palustris TaxID=1673888 RepID=A0ACD0NVC3_9BASI|nr:hypothetical protein IE53DRAFT_388082 [Violaceomyces palustris]